MATKVHLILVLCGILLQGICSLSEENNEKSSDIHNRQKRVAGGTKRALEHAPYLVAVLSNGHFHAPASLLTADIAITSAQTFKHHMIWTMTLQSRSAAAHHIHHFHRMFFLDENYNVSHPTHKNLVLINFIPPINFEVSLNRPIPIHSGSVQHQLLKFEVFNWAKTRINSNGVIVSEQFRSFPVQLINHEYCQQLYPGIINDGNICTYGLKAGQHGSGKDYGAPLIVDNNLLGIMVFSVKDKNPKPDVFMSLMSVDIRRWIHERVPSLGLF